jgi:hypothetical protein
MGEQHFADKKILSLGLRAAEEDSVNPTFAKPEIVSGYLLTLQKSEKLSCNILNINSSYFFNNIKL